MTTRKFEGKAILADTLKVTNTGDGLSKAMAIDSSELHIGDRAVVVIEGDVVGVDHKPISSVDEAGSRQVAVSADTMAIVDVDLVSEVLDEQRERAQRAEDERKGQGRLDDEEEDEGDDA